jgi:hypothetical protein
MLRLREAVEPFDRTQGRRLERLDGWNNWNVWNEWNRHSGPVERLEPLDESFCYSQTAMAGLSNLELDEEPRTRYKSELPKKS